MAFKQAEKSNSGSLPFFSEWVKEVDPKHCDFYNGCLIAPKWIKAVQSGKGYMINFDDEFALFVWKKSAIGSIIRKMIGEEQGYYLLLQFKQTNKGLSYELGIDDEVEVCVSEEEYEEGVFYLSVTTGNTPSIAPNDYRRFLSDIPLISEPKPVKFTTSPSSKPKAN